MSVVVEHVLEKLMRCEFLLVECVPCLRSCRIESMSVRCFEYAHVQYVRCLHWKLRAMFDLVISSSGDKEAARRVLGAILGVVWGRFVDLVDLLLYV